MDGMEDDMLWLDNKEDNILLAQLTTPENDLYDKQVSVENWNLLFDASDNDEFDGF